MYWQQLIYISDQNDVSYYFLCFQLSIAYCNSIFKNVYLVVPKGTCPFPQLTWAWQIFVDLIHAIMLSLSFLKIWSILSLGLSSSRGHTFSPEDLACIHQLWFSLPLPAVLLVDQKCIFYLNNVFLLLFLVVGVFSDSDFYIVALLWILLSGSLLGYFSHFALFVEFHKQISLGIMRKYSELMAVHLVSQYYVLVRGSLVFHLH